jgi:hypothetical protein
VQLNPTTLKLLLERLVLLLDFREVCFAEGHDLAAMSEFGIKTLKFGS